MTGATNMTRDWTPVDCITVLQIARHAGCPAIYILASISKEADFRCDAKNGSSSATGLPQLMANRKTGLYLDRYTRDEFIRLGISGQLEVIRERYKQRAGKITSLGRGYAIYAAPAAVDHDLDEDEPIYAEHGETRYGATRQFWLANSDWHLQGGPVTLKSLALCARVGEQFHQSRLREMVQRVTGAPLSWLDLWSPAVRAEVCGLITRDDVRRYQAERRLVADGVVGKKTVAALVLDYDPGSLA